MPAPRDGNAPARQAAAAPKPPTLIFAVANQKGGVGKTTTAVNLAASLATAEHRTLLVDCDPQGNASSGVGVRPRSVEVSIYDVLIGRVTLPQATIHTDVPLLDVVPATQDLVAAELELVDAPDRATRLRDAIRPHVGDYAFVVLDCPPSLGLLTLNALTAATRVVVPLQCEYYALEGLTHLMATIDRVRNVFNPELTIEGIVLTMYDGRTSLTHQVADEVKGHFRVFNAIIPRNVRLSEAPSHGKPALLYDVQSKGAQGYLSLAREILETHHGAPKRGRTKATKAAAAAAVMEAPAPERTPARTAAADAPALEARPATPPASSPKDTRPRT
ncbi:ParA family protein [Chondromyces apiculatus]|uniref:Chromosome (Plasmid) partitioning protein ParA / Sporulation initiation inhibitor protein Soj n=1 Tax=Chondromyces apiculatus DSM 436 TaxID=1192034 RepID=A0A017SX18_9BACT|nr:Chromosome (plasmid) partitioning protein ParA / Sporulation initiation inhibitor protein Soj [Chondromyces apiculatus DSM 436]